MIIPEGYPDRNVCIVGLGYVGLTLAATMATRIVKSVQRRWTGGSYQLREVR